jgi:tRNA threonylcarbamoyladenosine biosynthesis protein TsaB
MTTILSLDTTSRFSSISISSGENITIEYNFATRDELSSTLIPSIEFLLKSASLDFKDIDAIGIGIGPGLFTGIRVGLATLKGMALTHPKPVVPVTSLEALAYKYNDSSIPVVSIIDARRNEVYVAAYSFNQGEATQMGEPDLIHVDQLIPYLLTIGKCLLVGSGAEVHEDRIKTHSPKSKIFHRSYFLASEICKIATGKIAAKEYLTDLQELMPLYIRKPDAEQNLLIAQAKKATKSTGK